jgi:pimeloyl-ACP methyl ester carboxylesterase
VVAVAHGSTGIDEPCAPSLFPDLLGQSELVENLVKSGYAVAMADYQGLGAPGIHPYTDARTGGLNVIDSVRALRRTFPNVSDRWGIYGGSQGGGAAWAADEQAGEHAPELNLVGAIAVVPAADVSGIVDKAQRNQLTDEQRAAFFGIVESLARLHPDLDRDDFRRGSARENWDALTACAGPKLALRDGAGEALAPGEIAPGSPAAAAKLRQYLEAWALPQQRLSAPLSVVIGGKDVFIDSQWTLDAISRACAMGGTIDWDLQPDKGHGDVDVSAQLTWLLDRFEGKPVHNDCPPA